MINSWQKSADGQIPVILAASITSLVYKCANVVEDHLAEYGIHHPDKLFERYNSCVHSLNLSDSLFMGSEAPLKKGLEETWQVLRDFKEFWGTPGAQEKLLNLDNRQFRRTSLSGPFPFDDPLDFVSSCEPEPQVETNREYLSVVLKRMAQIIVQTSNWLARPLDRLPLFEEFASFILENGNTRVLSLNFGLRMLVESNRSYLKALSMKEGTMKCSPRTSSNTCRIQSLRLTKDVKRNIE